MLFATVIFSAGLGPLGLAWVLYPGVMHLRARLRPLKTANPDALRPPPRVGIVCAAHHAASEIGARVAALSALDYPQDRVRIVVVDDGSTDDTVRRAREAAAKAQLPVEVLALAAGGKAEALNAGVAHLAATAAPEVYVFCDVRQHLPPASLSALVAPFEDAGVAAVSGLLAPPDGARGPAAMFRRWDNALRLAEAATGSAIGATGAWHAVRSSHFKAMPSGLILDDVWIPLKAVFQGGRAVIAPRAVVVEAPRPSAAENRSRVRSLTGMFQLIESWPQLLHPLNNPVWSRFVGHRALRLLTPLGIALAAGGVVIGTLVPGPLWPLWATMTAAVVVGSAAIGALMVISPPVRAAATELADVFAPARALARFLARDFRWT